MSSLELEFELRYRINRYRRLQKLYKFSLFDKNNYNLLYKAMDDLRIEQQQSRAEKGK
jgi:hypothetical protein